MTPTTSTVYATAIMLLVIGIVFKHFQYARVLKDLKRYEKLLNSFNSEAVIVKLNSLETLYYDNVTEGIYAAASLKSARVPYVLTTGYGMLTNTFRPRPAAKPPIINEQDIDLRDEEEEDVT